MSSGGVAAGAEAALVVGEGRAQHAGHLAGGERFQPEEVAAAEQRRVHIKTGIVRRRADEPDVPLLDVGQQEVLLRLVEAVQLVDEEDGGLRRAAAGVGEDFAQLRDVGHHGVDADEAAFRLAGDDLGEAGFAAAGRAVEHEAAEAVAGDEARQEVAGLEDVGLARDLRQAARPHASGERLMGGRLGGQIRVPAGSFLAKE